MQIPTVLYLACYGALAAAYVVTIRTWAKSPPKRFFLLFMLAEVSVFLSYYLGRPPFYPVICGLSAVVATLSLVAYAFTLLNRGWKKRDMEKKAAIQPPGQKGELAPR